METLLNCIDFNKNPMLVVAAITLGILIFATILFQIIGKYRPGTQINELKARTRSWWIMAVMFAGAIIFSNRISYIAIAFLSFIAFREFHSILGFRFSDRRTLVWAFLSIPVQYYLAYIGWYDAYIIFIPVVMFMLLPMHLVIKGDTQGISKSMFSMQWILMLSVFGISHLAYLLSLPQAEGYEASGRGMLLFLVFITEINDVMQFTFGKLFGKHKIIPRISPNKTWEGFLGGLISTVLLGSALGFLTPLSNLHVVFVSVMIAVSGFVGDVVMSSIKRDIGIKDTGNAIPGHGGVLDRIDSLSFTAPTFFHLVYFIAY